MLAVPVIRGAKTAGERFAGALETLSIEGMMQDGKALQMGTSHYLGQNFSKSADVKFQNKDGELEFVYATSWGVSTRLIGALIMTHSDDTGLVLPPKLAPVQVIVIPIFKNEEERVKTVEEAKKVAAELKGLGVAVRIDERDGIMPGAKYYEWEGKGVPIRIEVGPKDMEKGSLCVARRFVAEIKGETPDALRRRRKSFLPRAEAIASIVPTLEAMQKELLERARALRAERTRVLDKIEDFEKFFKEEGGGFAWVHWAGDSAQEEEMAKRFETSIRCVPFEDQIPPEARGEGACILTGKPSKQRVLMSKSY